MNFFRQADLASRDHAERDHQRAAGRCARGANRARSGRRLGNPIPTLCYHKDLSVDSSCRLCMVEVDAGGTSSQAAACTQPMADSLVVRTETPAIVESRWLVLRMLLENYSGDPADTAAEDNELVRWARHYDVAVPKIARPELRYPIDSDPNPFVRVDLNQCILCTRCGALKRPDAHHSEKRLA